MAQFNQDNFNKEALKNAYNPEGLDQLVKITRPRGWIALVCILIFLVILVVWSIFGRVITTVSAPCIIYPEAGGPVLLTTQTQGYIMGFHVKAGEHIEDGASILTIKNGDTISDIKSPMAGQLISYMALPGQFLMPGQAYDSAYALFLPYNKDATLAAHVFIPPAYGKLIHPGMRVHIAMDQANPQEYGYLLGEVSGVSLYPQTEGSLANDLQNRFLIAMMSKEGAPYKALVALIPDANQPGHYLWSKAGTSQVEASPGSLCVANIITSEQAPISLVIPEFTTKLRR